MIYDPIFKNQNKENLFIENIDEIDPVNVIITPVKFHYFYISRYLNKNKNIFVEKPTLMPNENIYLKNIKNENIFTGYVYLYNKFILNLKKIISKKKIVPFLIKFERKNLGPIRKDVDVLFDLASHDISIIYLLFEKHQLAIKKVDRFKYLNSKNYDSYNIHLKINNQINVIIEVNWLNVVKERKISLFSNKSIIQYDELSNKIVEREIDDKFYSKTLLNIDNISHNTRTYKFQNNNPLKSELKSFLLNKDLIQLNKDISIKTQKLLHKIKYFNE